MKVVKFRKTLLNKDWIQILEHFNLVDKEKRLAFPSRLFMSKDDIKVVRKNTEKTFKEQGCSASKMLKYSEALHFLNYGASSCLENAIKSGYAIIEEPVEKKK